MRKWRGKEYKGKKGTMEDEGNVYKNEDEGKKMISSISECKGCGEREGLLSRRKKKLKLNKLKIRKKGEKAQKVILFEMWDFTGGVFSEWL
jgi:hypothetical protein